MEASSRLGLTPRMRDCFEAIELYIANHGCSPSFDDLAKALNLHSKGNIFRLLGSLQARGWIEYTPAKPRSIVISAGVSSGPAYVLPSRVELALKLYCATRGETAADIVADAVSLFLDEQDATETAA